jgi:hypothetical protein
MTFERMSLKTFGLSKRIAADGEERVRNAARIFLQELVAVTPVDKGWAVSNWRIGVNYMPTNIRPAFSPGRKGSTATANRAAVLANELPKLDKYKTGRTINVVNNAPHILKLNDGYSGQAKAGFIQAARASAQSKFRLTRI